MSVRMQQRRGTAEQWTLANPVLAEGELGWESDTNKFKIGNGIARWLTLEYFNATDEVDLTGYATEDYVDDAISNIDALPAQTDNAGKFLTTDGTDASWATVDALPAQADNAGKYLTTDGTVASWAELDLDSKADVLDPEFNIGTQILSHNNLGSMAIDSNPNNNSGITLRSYTGTLPSVGDVYYIDNPIMSGIALVHAGSSSLPDSDVLLLFTLQNKTNPALITALLDYGASAPTSISLLTAPSTVTISNTELASLDGIQSNIQSQLDAKLETSDLDGLATETYVDDAIEAIPAGTVVSATAPDPADGNTLWWNSTNATLYIYYDNAWVQAVAGVTGPQGPEGPVGATGASGLDWKGIWDDGATYVANDAVFYNNSSWFASASVPVGEVPSNSSTLWLPLALQGATGATGATGPQGPIGPAGPVGPEGPAADLTGIATEEYVDDAVAAKANATHTHSISDITDLQTELDSKLESADLTGYATETYVDDAIETIGSGLPDQAGNSGKYLTTDGTDASWATLDLSTKQDVVSGVTSTEIGYLDGVTSAIQTQLDAKLESSDIEGYATESYVDEAFSNPTIDVSLETDEDLNVVFAEYPGPQLSTMNVNNSLLIRGSSPSFNPALLKVDDEFTVVGELLLSKIKFKVVSVEDDGNNQYSINTTIVLADPSDPGYSVSAAQVDVQTYVAYGYEAIEISWNTGQIITRNFEITPTELSYLDGLTSNIQTQLNSLAGVTPSEPQSGTTTMQTASITSTGGTPQTLLSFTLPEAGTYVTSIAVRANADFEALGVGQYRITPRTTAGSYNLTLLSGNLPVVSSNAVTLRANRTYMLRASLELTDATFANYGWITAANLGPLGNYGGSMAANSTSGRSPSAAYALFTPTVDTNVSLFLHFFGGTVGTSNEFGEISITEIPSTSYWESQKHPVAAIRNSTNTTIIGNPIKCSDAMDSTVTSTQIITVTGQTIYNLTGWDSTNKSVNFLSDNNGRTYVSWFKL